MRLGHFILSFVIVATAAQAVPTYAPAEAVPGQPTAWAKSMIDVFSASDEVAMVRFRLQLHEPLAFKTQQGRQLSTRKDKKFGLVVPRG